MMRPAEARPQLPAAGQRVRVRCTRGGKPIDCAATVVGVVSHTRGWLDVRLDHPEGWITSVVDPVIMVTSEEVDWEGKRAGYVTK